MASKRAHPRGPEDRKPKQDPSTKAEQRRQAGPATEEARKHEEQLGNRSVESIVEGGVNEARGEPPEGYFTEAPGHQGGGKR